MRGINRRWEKMSKQSLALTQILEDYELHLQTEAKSERTIYWYRQKLRYLLRWMEAQSLEPILRNFNEDVVRAFIRYEQTKTTIFENNPFTPPKEGKVSSYTVHGYALAFKAFASWLAREGYTKGHVLAGVRRPKVAKVEPEWLREDEIDRLLSVFDRRSTLGARDYALVVTFLDTGLRCQELCGLTLDRADLEYGELKVLGKGNKERTVPIGVRTVAALRRYRAHFRPDVNVPYFFVNAEGGLLTTGAVQQIVARARKTARIPRLHVHLLRHTFAVHYLMAGGDAFSLQRILGHSTLDVTRNYVNLVQGQVKEKHRKYSPMDNLSLRADKPAAKALRAGKRLWAVR